MLGEVREHGFEQKSEGDDVDHEQHETDCKIALACLTWAEERLPLHVPHVNQEHRDNLPAGSTTKCLTDTWSVSSAVSEAGGAMSKSSLAYSQSSVEANVVPRGRALPPIVEIEHVTVEVQTPQHPPIVEVEKVSVETHTATLDCQSLSVPI